MNDPNTTIPDALRERAAEATRHLIGGRADVATALAQAYVLGFTAGVEHAARLAAAECEDCGDGETRRALR
jgi:hypothetical protein